MKKKIVAALLTATLLFSRTSLIARADQYTTDYSEPFLIESTAYCHGEITKDGSKVRAGIIAAKEEWLGLTAIVYEVAEDGSVGECRGIYEIKDTGSDYRLQNGTCIDFYIPDKEAAKSMEEKMYISSLSEQMDKKIGQNKKVPPTCHSERTFLNIMSFFSSFLR